MLLDPPTKLLNKAPSIFGWGAPRPGHVPAPKGSGRVPVISGRVPVWTRAGTVPAPKRPGRVPVISGRVPVWARAGTVPAPEESGRARPGHVPARCRHVRSRDASRPDRRPGTRDLWCFTCPGHEFSAFFAILYSVKQCYLGDIS